MKNIDIIKKFDKQTADEVLKRVVAQLTTFAEDHGIEIKALGGSFGETSFDCKLRLTVKSTDGKPVGREAEYMAAFYESYGFQKDDLGREFTLHGETYIISGIKGRSSKNCMLITRKADGKRQVCSVKLVLSSLGRTVPEMFR